jgi:hypothetical protein
MWTVYIPTHIHCKNYVLQRKHHLMPMFVFLCVFALLVLIIFHWCCPITVQYTKLVHNLCSWHTIIKNITMSDNISMCLCAVIKFFYVYDT